MKHAERKDLGCVTIRFSSKSSQAVPANRYDRPPTLVLLGPGLVPPGSMRSPARTGGRGTLCTQCWITLKLSLKQAIRSLLANRLYTLIVVTMLTLGISCTTVIFSAVNSILFGLLPYSKADRLVFVWLSNRRHAVLMNRLYRYRTCKTSAVRPQPSKTWLGCLTTV